MAVDTDRARTKARVKSEIHRLLAVLPIDDQADILADLTIAVEDSEPADTHHRKPEEKPNARRRAGRPKGSATAEGDTRTSKLLEILKPGNKLSIGECAELVYGSNEELPRNRIRSLLAALKKRKLVRHVGIGKWEAIAKKD
jgi:hypothetical protein